MAIVDVTRYGRKHVCFGCGTKFYDLNRPAPLCPRCGANQLEAPPVVTPAVSGRRRRALEDELATVGILGDDSDTPDDEEIDLPDDATLDVDDDDDDDDDDLDELE